MGLSTSGSLTAVAERSGAKTQLTGVTGAALIIVIIVLIPGLFRNLPPPALAAVVITASLSLADIPGTERLWKQRKAEFLLSIEWSADQVTDDPADQARPAPEPARRATLPRHPASWRQTDNHPLRMTLAGGRAHRIIWISPPALLRGRQVKEL